jgi:MYXO-CTERM domain-containing protein
MMTLLRSVMRRVLVILVVAVAGVLGLAAPAWAHTSVTVEPAVAGSANALVTVNAAAESDTAGIASLRVVLPAGITPGDVSYVDGPPGWALQPDAEGYVVGGPAVPVGRDAVHRVRVTALPSTPTLVFKVLQTYTDGRVDRWIEVPSGANAEPEFPAPVVTLAAPPGGFASSSAPSSPAAPPASDQVDSTTPAGPDLAADSGSALPWIIVTVAVVAALAVGAVLLIRRRRS